MNASTEEQPSGSLDFLKWSIAILLLAGSVVGNYIYGDQSVLIRAIVIVVAVIIAGLIAGQTKKVVQQ
jgi:preprotein translocase subunit SecE